MNNDKKKIQQKINLLRKILILYYEINYTKQTIISIGEYWVVNPKHLFGCGMLNDVIDIEIRFVEGNFPAATEMEKMNKYYKQCLTSTRVRKYLHYDKKY